MEQLGECLNCIELETFLQVEKKKVAQKNRLITLFRALVKSYEAKDLSLTLNDLSRIYESSASEVNILKQRLSLYLNENHELLQLKNELSSRNDFLEKKFREIEDELSHLKFVNKQLGDYYREKEANDDQHKDRLKKLAKKLLVYEPKNSEARKILNLQNTPIESDQKSLKTVNKKKAEVSLKDMKKDNLRSNESTTADAKPSDILQLGELDMSINSEYDQDINDINSFINSEESPDTPSSIQDISIHLDEKINEEDNNLDALVSQDDKIYSENTCQDMNKIENTINSSEEYDKSLHFVGNISDSASNESAISDSCDFSNKMSIDSSYGNIETGKKSPFRSKCVSVKHMEAEENDCRDQSMSGKKEVEIRYKDSIDTFEFDNSLPDLISPLKSDDHTAIHNFLDHEETISEHDAVTYGSSEHLNSSDKIGENIANKKNDKGSTNIKNECFSSKIDQVDKSKKSPVNTKYKHTNEDLIFNRKHINQACFPLTGSYNSNYQFQFPHCMDMSCCNNTFDSRPPIVLKLYNCSNVEISIPSSSQKQDLPIIAVKDKNNMEKNYINTSALVNKLVESYWLRSSFTTLRTNDKKNKMKCKKQPLLKPPNYSKQFSCSNSCNCKENLKRSFYPYFKRDYDELKNSDYYFLDYIFSNDNISSSISSDASDSEEDVKCGRLFPIKLGKQFDIDQICSSFQSLTINCSLPKHTFVNFDVSNNTKNYNEGNSSLLSISKPPIFHNTLQKTLVSKSGTNDWIFGKNCNTINQQEFCSRVALKPSNFLNSKNDRNMLYKRSQNGNIINKQTSETERQIEHFSNQKTKSVNVYDTLKNSIPGNQLYQNSNELHEKNENTRTKHPFNSVGFEVQPEKHLTPKKESRVMMQSWIGLRSSADYNKLDKSKNLETSRNIQALTQTLNTNRAVSRNKKEFSNCDNAFSSNVGESTSSIFDLSNEKDGSSKVSETGIGHRIQKQNVVESQENTLPQTYLQGEKRTRPVFDIDHEKGISSKISESETGTCHQKQNVVESLELPPKEKTLPQKRKGAALNPANLLRKPKSFELLNVSDKLIEFPLIVFQCTSTVFDLDHEKDLSSNVSETVRCHQKQNVFESHELSPEEKALPQTRKGAALDSAYLLRKECIRSVPDLDHEKDVSSKVSETGTCHQKRNVVEPLGLSPEEKAIPQTKKSTVLDPAYLLRKECTRSVPDLDHEKDVSSKVSKTGIGHQKRNVVESLGLSPEEKALTQTRKGAALDPVYLLRKECTRSVFDLDHEKNVSSNVSETDTGGHQKQNIESQKLPVEETTLSQTRKGAALDPANLRKECTRSVPDLNHEKDVSSKVSETGTGHQKRNVVVSLGLSPEEKALPQTRKGAALDPVYLLRKECARSVTNLDHEKDVSSKVSETGSSHQERNVELLGLSPEEKVSPQTRKGVALDPAYLLRKEAVETKSKSQNYLPLKEKKLPHERAGLPKYEMCKSVKNPKPLKNISKTDFICPKKPLTKKISGIKISVNKAKSNCYVNKACKQLVMEESYSKMSVEINQTDELRQYSTDNVTSESETGLSNIEAKSSSNSKVNNFSDSKATIPPKANSVHASHNTFTDEEDDYLDSELQEIFKETRLVHLLSPLRLTPEISVEEEAGHHNHIETFDAFNENKELKENSNYFNSRNVTLPNIILETKTITKQEDIENNLIENVTETIKEEHFNSKTNNNSIQENGYIDNKLKSSYSSEDLNKYNIFYDEDEIHFDAQNTTLEEAVSPIYKPLNGVENSVISNPCLEKLESQNIGKTHLIVNNNEADSGTEPYFPIYDNTCDDQGITDGDKTGSTYDDKDKINSSFIDDKVCSVQDLNDDDEICSSMQDDTDKGNINVSGYDSNKTSLSLGFYVNRSDSECTINCNETSLIKEENVECFNLSKEQNPEVKSSDTQIISPITCDRKDSNVLVEDICQEDLPIIKEEIKVYKRKLVHDGLFEDMSNKKQKTIADNGNISCENDVFICALKYLSAIAITTNKDDVSAFRKPSPQDILIPKIAIHHIKNLIYGVSDTALNNYDIMNNTVKKIKQVSGASAVTLAKAIIEIICESEETEEMVKSKIFIPSMIKTVKLCYLIAVSFIGYNRDFVMEFLQVFEQYIPSFDDKSLTVKEGSQLAVFYTSFCRSYNLDYKVKCLIFDVLYTRNMKAYPFVYRIIQTWPDVIPSSQSCSSKDCLLTQAIIFILMSGTSTVDERSGQAYCTGSIRNYLHKHFGYDCNATRRHELSEKIIERITSRGGSLALVLLCKCEPWEWSCSVVEKKLFPILLSKNSAQMDEYTLCEYILTLGRIVRGFPSTKSAHIVNNTLEILNNILHSSNSTHLSEIIIEAISLLRRHNLMKCTSILINWKPTTKQVTKNTMDHIKSILNVKNIMHWKHVYSGNSTNTNHQNKRTFRNKRKL